LNIKLKSYISKKNISFETLVIGMKVRTVCYEQEMLQGLELARYVKHGLKGMEIYH